MIEGLGFSFESLRWYEPVVAFVAGFISSISPCVYPLLPIMIANVVGEASDRRSAIINAFAFSLGSGLLFFILALLSVFAGIFFNRFSTSGISYLVVGVACMLSAFHILGLLRFPYMSFSFNGGRGKLIELFLLGFVTAVLGTTCTAPYLLALMAFASTKTHPMFSIILFLCFSAGFAMLFFVLGLFSSLLVFLPRSGRWLDIVHKMAGWALLLMAGYFLFNAGRYW